MAERINITLGGARERIDRQTPSSQQLERFCWGMVAITIAADIATTVVGLQLGLVEANPIARSVIDGYGVAGMLALKGFAVGWGLLCRPLLPEKYRAIVPAGLAIPWVIAVGINLVMMYTILL